MIPTPDLSHLTSADYATVYEPAEDSFLLLDALEQDEQFLKLLRPSICLEVGSGSGCVSAFLGAILKTSAIYLCTDINPHACVCTSSTGFKNNIPLDVVNTSFAAPLAFRLRKSVDVILFNPPYVPTTIGEALEAQQTHDIAGAWAGGIDGMEVTSRFLHCVDDLLSPTGIFYMVALKQNNIPEIQQRMNESYGMSSEIILQRCAGREQLFIVRFRRSSS